MKPTITVDTTNFDLAWSRYLALTKRSLPKVVNARMFFILVRAYLILPPKSPVAARQKARASLMSMVQTRKNPGRQVPLLYAIVNSGRGGTSTSVSNRTGKTLSFKSDRGLYGPKMKVAAAKVMARTLGGVGYLRALVVKGIRGFQSFRQFGTKKIATGKYGNPNKAAVSLAAKYDTQLQSVAIYRRSSNRPHTVKATDGKRPTAIAILSGNEIPQINSEGKRILEDAFKRSLADETEEINQYLTAKLGEDAVVATKSLGIIVN